MNRIAKRFGGKSERHFSPEGSATETRGNEPTVVIVTVDGTVGVVVDAVPTLKLERNGRGTAAAAATEAGRNKLTVLVGAVHRAVLIIVNAVAALELKPTTAATAAVGRASRIGRWLGTCVFGGKYTRIGRLNACVRARGVAADR